MRKARLFTGSLPEHGTRPQDLATGLSYHHVLSGGTETLSPGSGGTPTEAVGAWKLGWLSGSGAPMWVVRGAHLSLCGSELAGGESSENGGSWSFVPRS